MAGIDAAAWNGSRPPAAGREREGTVVAIQQYVEYDTARVDALQPIAVHGRAARRARARVRCARARVAVSRARCRSRGRDPAAAMALRYYMYVN